MAKNFSDFGPFVAKRLFLTTHVVLTVMAFSAIFAAFRAAHLPLSIRWDRLVPMYWVSLGIRSIAATGILMVIGLPAGATIKPLLSRFMAQKGRLVIFAAFVLWDLWKIGGYLSFIWIVVAILCTELYDRNHGDIPRILGRLVRVLPAAAYFFLGLIAVFAWNDWIAATKDMSASDAIFMRMDSYLLGGHSVSGMAHWASVNISPHLFAAAEAVYYGMFDQIGAAIILLSIFYGVKPAMRLVGTILTAYYIALLIFYLRPSMGPFYTCPNHFSHFPVWLETYDIQRTVIANASVLSTTYRTVTRVGADYFIAFPCMHIVQPLIVLWYLRGWRRMVYCLIAYDLLLAPAILILEWHYVVDLLGGVLVAIVAILINGVAGPQKLGQPGQTNAIGAPSSREILQPV